MPITVGGTARALTKPTPWSAFLLAVIGVVALVFGLNAGATANALFERTRGAVATVDMTARQLQFRTFSGEQIATGLLTDCKERARPPATNCMALFETGDEVLISYDPENPSYVWVGDTPGGGWATLWIALGIAAIITGTLGLYWLFLKPRVAAIFQPAADALSKRGD